MVSIPEEDCDLVAGESGKMVKSACRARKKTFLSTIRVRWEMEGRDKRLVALNVSSADIFGGFF